LATARYRREWKEEGVAASRVEGGGGVWGEERRR
jgi:hypothetical protein